jgi:cobalt/nickel transport system permease protein
LSQEGFLGKNIAALTSALESVVLNEEVAQRSSLLHGLDPRDKLFTFVLFIVVVGLARSLWILGLILLLILALVILARISPAFFGRRVLLFLPLSAIIALPALFITPGDGLLLVGGKVIITVQGLRTAAFLILRVMDSISLGLLLVLTTPWNSLLQSFRWFRIPPVLVDILGMTYRYIFLLLHTANSMFLARRSRSLGVFSGAENRRWLGRALGTTLAKTQHLSEEVYLAMLARGYQGEIFAAVRLKFGTTDILWLSVSLGVAAAILWGSYR